MDRTGTLGLKTAPVPTVAPQERQLTSQDAQIKWEVLQMKEQGGMI